MSSKVMAPFVVLLTLSCTDYGKKSTFDKLDLYAKEGISKAEVRSAARVLETLEYTKRSTSVQLARMNDTYHIRFVIDPTRVESEEVKTAFEAVKVLFETKAFTEKKVKVDLCDGTFKNVVKTL